MKLLKMLSLGIFFLCLTTTTQAQTDKGKILLGGNSAFDMSYSNSKRISADNEAVQNSNNLSLSFAPIIGYFITNNLAIGVELPIRKSHSDYGPIYNSSSYGISPIVKYYFGQDNVKPYINAQIGFAKSYSSNESEDGNVFKSNGNTLTSELGGGIALFINEKVSMDLGLNYFYQNHYSGNFEDQDQYHYLTLEIGLNVFL